MIKKIGDFFRNNILIVILVTLITLVSGLMTIVCSWSDFMDNFLLKSISVSVIGVIWIILAISIVLIVILFFWSAENKKSNKYPELLSFHASYRNTNWNSLFGKATKSITICSFYLDSFTVWTKDDIAQFLKKDDVKLTVIVSNYNSEGNLNLIARLFPQYSLEVVKNKITGTKSRIIEILNNAGVSIEKFDFYVYDNFLNYSYILIDDKYLYLSIYEMERGVKMDSPAVIFDLAKNEELKKYIQKENDAIIKKSHKE